MRRNLVRTCPPVTQSARCRRHLFADERRPVFLRVYRAEERIEGEGQEAGGVILATPLRILNPLIVSAGMEAISRGE